MTADIPAGAVVAFDVRALPAGWEHVLLGELCIIRRGSSPRPIGDPRFFVGGTIPWIKIGDATKTGGRYLFETAEHVNDVGAERSVLVPPGSLIVANSGVSLGFAIITGVEGCIHDGWLLLTEFRRVDRDYLFYVINHFTSRLRGLADGSTQPNLNTDIARRLLLPLPPLPEQKRIAELLVGLDDKIEQNRRTSRKLEALARAVFKAWFVDFEPVKAKAAGATAFAGMPAETFATLPTRLVDSEIGRLPESWPVVELASIADAVKGLSYKGAGLTKAFVEGETLPLHSLNAVYEGGGYKYEGIKYYSGEYKDRHIVHPGDLIIANTEQGFEYRLIGFPAIVPKRFGTKGLFTHHIFRLRPRADSVVGSHFLYYALLGGRLRDEVCGRTNGTTVNSLAIDGLQRPKLCIPTSGIADAFESMATSMHQLIENCADESERLAALRDYLLPRLLSGRVRSQPKGG